MVVDLPVITGGLVIGEMDLATGKVKVNHKNPIQFTCKLSTDCCVKPSIPVTDFDIKRIEERGYALDQIVTDLSPIIHFSQGSEVRAERHYWMKRKPFTNSCTFLREGLCSIHEFKPFACRIFPFQLTYIAQERIQVMVHTSNLCRSINAVPKDKAANEQLLKDILDVVQIEDRYRQEYFVSHASPGDYEIL